MKTIIAAAAVLSAFSAASIAISATANAQGKAPVYRYCLMDGSHADTNGMVLCRYETLAQCMASRNGFGDTCYINPEYGRRR